MLTFRQIVAVVVLAWATSVPALGAGSGPQLPADDGQGQQRRVMLGGDAYMMAFLASRPTGQAIVVTPGGGYQQTSIDKYYDWARFFNGMGVSLFAVRYRMPQGDRSIPMGDAERALQTVHDSAAVWHVSPQHIGVMGTSAGGHLATTTSWHVREALRPAFQILFSPVITMGRQGCHRGSVANFLGADTAHTAVRDRFSSDKQVGPHTPPTLIFASTDDRTVPVEHNAVAMYRAMMAARRPVSLHLYPTGGHGGTSVFSFEYHEAMEAVLRQWLKDK